MKANEKLCSACNRPVPIGEEDWHETMECPVGLRESKPSRMTLVTSPEPEQIIDGISTRTGQAPYAPTGGIEP